MAWGSEVPQPARPQCLAHALEQASEDQDCLEDRSLVRELGSPLEVKTKMHIAGPSGGVSGDIRGVILGPFPVVIGQGKRRRYHQKISL